MCFGSCRVLCDNCKPKFVYCPNCGHKCMLFHTQCKKCKTPLTEEMKDAARAEWEIRSKERHERDAAERAAELAAQGVESGAVPQL